jgi:hypothetical protein
MFAAIKSQMLASAAAPAFPAGATVGVVWGLSVREILQVVIDCATREAGYEAVKSILDALIGAA